MGQSTIRKPWSYYLYDLAALLFNERVLNAALRKTIPIFLLIPPMRQNIQANMRRVFFHTHKREPRDEELAALLKEMEPLFAQRIINSYALPKNPEGYLKNSELEFVPALQDLLKEGRGAILATPHFGDDGMIYGSLACLGIPVTVMVNEARGYQWASEINKNLHFIGLGEGAMKGLKALRNNETLLLYDDMNYFPESRLTNFFGAPFPPPHGIARMALTAPAPILPVYSIFESGRCRILNDEPIRSRPDASQEELERQLLLSMERFIGRYPAHWLIFHPMWDLAACRKAWSRQLSGIVFHNRMDTPRRS